MTTRHLTRLTAPSLSRNIYCCIHKTMPFKDVSAKHKLPMNLYPLQNIIHELDEIRLCPRLPPSHHHILAAPHNPSRPFTRKFLCNKPTPARL